MNCWCKHFENFTEGNEETVTCGKEGCPTDAQSLEWRMEIVIKKFRELIRKAREKEKEKTK